MQQAVVAKRVGLGLRPYRAAVLIPDSLTHEETIPLISTLSQTWGGMIWALIPTDGFRISELFWRILKKYDPDVVTRYNVTASGDLWKEIERRSSLLEVIGDHAVPIWPDNVGYPFTNLRACLPTGRLVERTDSMTSFSNIDVVADSTSKVLLYSWLGLLPDGERQALKETDLAIDEIVLDVDAGDSVLSVFDRIWPQFSPGRALVRDFNLRYVGSFSKSDFKSQPLTAVCGQSLLDFALFWNLRALRGSYYAPTVCWVPAAGEDLPKALAAVLLTQQFNIARECADLYGDRRLLLTSTSVPQDQLGPYMEATADFQMGSSSRDPVRVVDVEPNDLDQLVPAEVQYWEANNSPGENASIVQFLDGEGLALLPTPVPKHVAIDARSKMRWMVDVNIEGIRVPPRRCLRPLFMDRGGVGGVRVSRGGVAYEALSPLTMGYMTVESMLVKPKLILPSDGDVINLLGNEGGVVLRPSDAGQFEQEFLRMAGGLNEVGRLLRDHDVAGLFFRFVDRTSNIPGVDDGQVLIRDRRYIAGRGMEKLFGDKVKATSTVQLLLERGIVHRGLAIKCPHCRNAAWYPLTDLSDQVTCNRCSRSHVFAAQSEIYFRLDELVCQALLKSSHISLLALDSLRRLNPDGFMFATARDIYKAAAPDDVWFEADFIAICEGRLIVGEGKSGGDIDQSGRQQLQKYRELCQLVGADELLIATDSLTWSDRMQDYFPGLAEQFRQTGTEVRTWVGSDLGSDV